ncbi:hypothetical protein BS78_10G145700 [Paspalum vaginatum]|nr:hypothetical protein BS78_10G145700 [Paspalum vaginatum]
MSHSVGPSPVRPRTPHPRRLLPLCLADPVAAPLRAWPPPCRRRRSRLVPPHPSASRAVSSTRPSDEEAAAADPAGGGGEARQRLQRRRIRSLADPAAVDRDLAAVDLPPTPPSPCGLPPPRVLTGALPRPYRSGLFLPSSGYLLPAASSSSAALPGRSSAPLPHPVHTRRKRRRIP